MKRLLSFAVSAVLCLLVLSGCSRTGDNNHLWLDAEAVDYIEIDPSYTIEDDLDWYADDWYYGDEYRWYEHSHKVHEIINYLNSLDLSLTEQQEPLAGQTYVLRVAMKDGTQREFYHNGNTLFKESDGALWMEMSYLQAVHLEDLIWKYGSDR